MNLYLDTISALTQRYSLCKQDCLDQNSQLRQDLSDMEDDAKAGQRTRYFDPMTSDPCLSQCRAQFYFLFKRINVYFGEDHGFYVESASNFPIINT